MVRENLIKVQQKIDEACERSGRDPKEVTLIAVSKTKPIEMIEEEYVVLLNSDVEVAPGWLEPLVSVLDRDENVAAVQPKILAYRDRSKFEYAGASGGYIDYLGFPFCRGRVMDTTERDCGQYDNEVDVFWATGASLCIRRDVYLSLIHI